MRKNNQLNTGTRILRVISLRGTTANDETFESVLQNAGHKVTVLSSTEPAFALVNSSWPDVVVFDPVSQFGMSGSIQRLRSSFDGPVIAVGRIPDPTISAMLEELGVHKFAASASELLGILRDVPTRTTNLDADTLSDAAPSGSNKTRSSTLTVQSANKGAPLANFEMRIDKDDNYAPEITQVVSRSLLGIASIRNLVISVPVRRWRRTAIGFAIVAAVVIAVAIPFLGTQWSTSSDQAVARALPRVPGIVSKPLVPLTLAELSGEILPLEIAGIQDRDVTEDPAVAFWGDTAPDALVTVNGSPIDVSEYGAFVVDYPLEDGANFIEVLASDFQGRTTSKSFTIVSLQP